MRFWRKKTEGEYFTDDDFCPRCFKQITEENTLVSMTTIAATDDADTIEDDWCDDCFDEEYPAVD